MQKPAISSGFSVPQKSCLSVLLDTIFNNANKTPSSLYIRNPDIVRRKLSQMMSHGLQNLQVISDFDWTLSRFFRHDGQLNPSCHGIFERDPEITHEARNKLRMLKQTYGSVEFDKNIPHTLKIPYMLEWWDISHRVIVSCNIHKETLRKTVYNSDLQLRDGVPDFLSTLNKHDIPTVVFSAGLGDVIELILEKEGLLYKNIRIASNFMNFNENGLLVSFQTPCIHTFNKTFGSFPLNDEDRSVFSSRRCVILLGDSLYDQHMADGLIEEDIRENTSDSETSVILKIGFLNGKLDSLLDEYMKLYDIVLPFDGSFGLPLEIVNCIVESERMKHKEII